MKKILKNLIKLNISKKNNFVISKKRNPTKPQNYIVIISSFIGFHIVLTFRLTLFL